MDIETSKLLKILMNTLGKYVNSNWSTFLYSCTNFYADNAVMVQLLYKCTHIIEVVQKIFTVNIHPL